MRLEISLNLKVIEAHLTLIVVALEIKDASINK